MTVDKEDQARLKACERMRRYRARHGERIREQQRERQSRPEAVERRRLHRSKPEIQAHRSQYNKDYRSRPTVREHLASEEVRSRRNEQQRRRRREAPEWERTIRVAKANLSRDTGLRISELPREMIEAKAALMLLRKEVRKNKQRSIATPNLPASVSNPQ